MISYKDKRIVKNLINKFDLQNIFENTTWNKFSPYKNKLSILKSPVPKTVIVTLKNTRFPWKFVYLHHLWYSYYWQNFKFRVYAEVWFFRGLLAPPPFIWQASWNFILMVTRPPLMDCFALVKLIKSLLTHENEL